MAYDGFPGWRIKRLILALSVLIIPTVASAAEMPSASTCDTTKGACWKPPLASRWQYQLQGNIAYASTGGINMNITYGAAALRPSVFDIDLYVDPVVFGNNYTLNTAAVTAIHAAGGRAICYCPPARSNHGGRMPVSLTLIPF